jgi:SAM-dependent methyltransferase
MGQPQFDLSAFHEFELAGWDEKADPYFRLFSPITDRAVASLLDAARVGSGITVLDVGSGPGYAAAQAAARGASVVGVDFATRMVALATNLHPGVTFRQADAEQLPFPNDAFGAVVGNFLLPHLPRPELAAREFARVLAPGGTVALTSWDLPERTRLSGVFAEAVRAAGAAAPVGLPDGPPFSRFAVDAEMIDLLQGAGFGEIAVQPLTFDYRVADLDELWNTVLGGTVRTSVQVLRQPEETLRRIRAALATIVREYEVDGGIELPVSIKLASGRKTKVG